MSTSRAVVIAPYPVTTSAIKGGAQTVAAQLCQRLAELGYAVEVLLCDAWQDSAASGDLFVDSFRRSDCAVSASGLGASPRDVSAVAAQRTVESSDLVIVMDRWVGRIDTDAPVVLLLSNLAYANETTAARQSQWNQAWVPSDFLAAQFTSINQQVPVVVVPPTVTGHQCPRECADIPAAIAGIDDRRLFFPHRWDTGKGVLDAVELLRLLVSEDPQWTLLVTATSGHQEPGMTSLITDTFQAVTGSNLREHFVVLPWIPQHAMACVYAACDATLIGTTLPEGFGLVLYESLAAGTPVVTTRAGNLATVDNPGVYAVDLLASAEGVAAAAQATASRVVTATKRAVQQHFSPQAQHNVVRAALHDLMRRPQSPAG